MGIEPNASKPKDKPYSESKRSKRRQKKTSMVQRLYETCQEVFADCGPGVVPSSDKIDRLKNIMDSVRPADVGLNPNLPFFKVKTTDRLPRITYLHIYECDKFSIGIFCLPPSAVIPLHNHPQMTVFSKLLFGSMHVKSYDWVDSGYAGTPFNSSPPFSNEDRADLPPASGARLAKGRVNSVFTAPCKTSILYPADGGNMHCFTGVTPCAVLDVLGPPYCDSDGRHCQYYLEHPFSDSSGEGKEKDVYAWLEERENPEDLTIIGSLYNGPKIVPI